MRIIDKLEETAEDFAYHWVNGDRAKSDELIGQLAAMKPLEAAFVGARVMSVMRAMRVVASEGRKDRIAERELFFVTGLGGEETE